MKCLVLEERDAIRNECKIVLRVTIRTNEDINKWKKNDITKENVKQVYTERILLDASKE